MSRNTIRVLVVLALVSIGGIIVTQIYWFKRAFDTEAQQFNRDVNTALYNVANQFFEINKAAIPSNNPIKQLSSNYYVVMINNEIDANLLEFLLTSEFEKRNIEADFEYGIYDCTNDKMVYGNYVSMSDDQTVATNTTLPKWEDQNYYFGVQFPNTATLITSRMEVWLFSSAVLAVVIIFFAYSLFIILKQKRLSEIQKDFINNMTHEFKTPIATISLSAEVLKNRDIIKQPDRLHSYATIIENENLRLKNQVERVLQMASLEQEEIALNKSQLNMHEVIEETMTSFKLANADKNITISTDFKAINDKVFADKLHISNVLNNLLDNAVKYCYKDPEITIKTANNKDTIAITLIDNGIGISPEHQKKVFNKFYRVPTGNVHDVKGFGLGLNYVNIIVKAHQGEVSLAKSDDKGSIFKLTFKNG